MRKSLYFRLLLLSLSVALSVPCGFAQAYTLGDCKMNTQIWYRASSVFTDTTRSEMRSCMAQWNEYLPEWRRVCYNSDVHYMTYRPTSRDGSNFIYKLPDSDPTNLATNYYWWNGSGYLLESDININYNQPWDNGAVVGAYDVKSVFLHEIGHTVGLGHSLVREAVMFRTFPTNWVRTTFSYDDLNGLAARY